MRAIRDAISQMGSEMTRGQRLLADFVIRHCERAAFMTSFELAGVTGVSQSTVMRFVSALGYDGFSDLQEALRHELKYRLNILERFEVMSENAESDDILRVISMTDAVNIKKTAEENSADALTALATRLVLAPRVYVYGQGLAAAAAVYLAGYLDILLANVRCVNLAGTDALTALAGIESGDALISVSFPPHTAQTLELLDFCRSRDAVIVTISESDEADAAKRADIALRAEWGDFGVNGSMAPVISLCGAIVCVLAKTDENAHKKLRNHADAAIFAQKTGEK